MNTLRTIAGIAIGVVAVWLTRTPRKTRAMPPFADLVADFAQAGAFRIDDRRVNL